LLEEELTNVSLGSMNKQSFRKRYCWNVRKYEFNENEIWFFVWNYW
jgi:hypothetical protein